MSAYPNLTEDTIQSLTAFFEYVDTNHDGFITVLEIQEACVVDYNDDNVISADELVKAGQQWLQYYFTAEDLDADQRLTLHELLQFNNDSAP